MSKPTRAELEDALEILVFSSEHIGLSQMRIEVAAYVRSNDSQLYADRERHRNNQKLARDLVLALFNHALGDCP